MKNVFLIIDRTDANRFKPFVAIAKNAQVADVEAEKRKKLVPSHARHLIEIKPFPVTDFDENKNNAYVLFDKTDQHHKSPVQGIYFDMNNGSKALEVRRKKLSTYAHKLVYLQYESLI